MKYRIIGAKSPAELEREVNKAIKLGWKPIGGVCSDTAFDCGDYLFQGMVFGGEK